MRNRHLHAAPFALLALSAALPAALFAAPIVAPETVSPGEPHRFARLRDGCPTFSWAAVEQASAVELLVYRIVDGRLAGSPTLRQRIAPRATSWSPSADRCLTEPGRYAWFLRAGAGSKERAETEISKALLFELPNAPSEADVRTALETLRRHLSVGGSLAAAELGRLAVPSSASMAETATVVPSPQAGGAEPEAILAPGITAIAGDVPDTSGVTHGVYGTSHSPDGAGVGAENSDAAGADLLLAGATPAKVTESGLSRSSASTVTFDFTNPGAGDMTLTVDGSAVKTLATDGAGSTLDADLLDGLDSATLVTGIATPAAGGLVGGAGGGELSLGMIACADGEVLKRIGGAWACVPDGAVVYVRWGRTVCPAGASLVFSGYVASGYYSHPGGISSQLCLTSSPTWGDFDDASQDGALLYATEYQTATYGLAATLGALDSFEVPCSLCLREGAQVVITLPGSKFCTA